MVVLGSQAPPFTSRGMLPESLSARQHSVMNLAAVVISTRPVFELKDQEFPECTTITTHVLSDTSHSSSCVVNFVVCGEMNQFKYLVGLDQIQHCWCCIYGAGGRVGSDKGLSIPFSLSLSPSSSPSAFLSGWGPLPAGGTVVGTVRDRGRQRGRERGRQRGRQLYPRGRQTASGLKDLKMREGENSLSGSLREFLVQG